MSLGENYLSKFKTGDYVCWRTLSFSEDEYYNEFYGIVVEVTTWESKESRPVYYARILENKTNKTIYVVLSCLIKIETN